MNLPAEKKQGTAIATEVKLLIYRQRLFSPEIFLRVH